jgi:hypothetical protein
MEAGVTTPRGERRCCPRLAASELGLVSARVRAGDRASVIDLSAGGALIELTRRLLPGAFVELQVCTTNQVLNARGRVVRSTIVRLDPSAVSYRAAIAFDPHLSPWDEHACGNRVPTDAPPFIDGIRVDTTRSTV